MINNKTAKEKAIEICNFFNEDVDLVLSNSHSICENTRLVRGICVYILREYCHLSNRGVMEIVGIGTRRGVQYLNASTKFRIHNIKEYKAKYDNLIKELPHLIE